MIWPLLLMVILSICCLF